MVEAKLEVRSWRVQNTPQARTKHWGPRQSARQEQDKRQRKAQRSNAGARQEAEQEAPKQRT